jgi:hypothetical protein
MLLARSRNAIQPIVGIARQVGRFNQPRMSSSEVSASTTGGPSKSPTLVMQIILRRDLQTVRSLRVTWEADWQEHDWPVGPLMAQAAHAATAVLAEHQNLPEVKSYLGDLCNMRKVVMEVSSVPLQQYGTS